MSRRQKSLNDTYAEYMRSPAWWIKRRAKLDSVRVSFINRCERCRSGTGIEVHHKTYERLGNELLSDLEVVCKSCHDGHHGQVANIVDSLMGRLRAGRSIEDPLADAETEAIRARDELMDLYASQRRKGG